jgi:mono/diheme cytochrome c family protein
MPMTVLVMALLMPSAMLLYAAAPVQKRAKTPQKNAAAVTFEKNVAPLVQQFCGGCHGASNPAGGLGLVTYKAGAAVLKARDIWERVASNVSSGTMPPEGAPKPTEAQKALIVSWIESTLSKADCDVKDPGRVTLRRLNRQEYNNTIRDLVGVDLRPADDFPSDDVGYGFDNIGDVLSLSPLLMEKYLTAAEKVSRAAVAAPEDTNKPAHFEAETLPGASKSSFDTLVGHIFASNGEFGVEYDFPVAGEYKLRARAFGQQAGPEPCKMALRLDGKDLNTVEVRVRRDAAQVYETKTTVPAGKHKFTVAFLNDFYNDMGGGRVQDRNLVVDYFEIQPPLSARGPLPASHKRIIFVEPTPANKLQVARKILAAFASRAYRRPASAVEVDRLVKCVSFAEKQGESFERGIQLAMQSVLVSPHFLFKVELDPAPNNPKASRMLNSYEMASRLSYFLWSSMPDEELFDLAAKGKLQDTKVVAAQVRRMLKDPKARALADNFAGQWLTLRNLASVSPDPKLFPGFDEKLRTAMRTETELFFQAIVGEDRSILDFIDGKFTYLNEPLAKHYGIEGVTGEQFRKVNLTGSERGGLITQASILTVTSNPTRTSPVKRGKWVLEQLLGTPPPPPPPGVEQLADDKPNVQLTGTLRQRMEQHRKNPSCASCHARMDPIGFGLENYDAVGKWRVKDGDLPVDASGTLPGSQSFKGPAELKTILKSKKDLFAKSLTEKLMTFALGRGIEPADKCNIDEIIKGVAKRGYRFSAIVDAIVQSDPFRKRRGDGTLQKAQR